MIAYIDKRATDYYNTRNNKTYTSSTRGKKLMWGGRYRYRRFCWETEKVMIVKGSKNAIRGYTAIDQNNCQKLR